jgi:hypothetical protein
LSFAANIGVPEPISSTPATDRQCEAVRLFYRCEIDGLTDCQAHMLLACREYGRLCAEIIFKRYPKAVRNMLGPCLAAFVSADDERAAIAVRWSERNFNSGTGAPRVRGLEIFPEVEQFASYLEGCMDMNGWTLEAIKQQYR